VIFARLKNSTLGHLEHGITEGRVGDWTALANRITIFYSSICRSCSE
jgi:hypothetical protein